MNATTTERAELRAEEVCAHLGVSLRTLGGYRARGLLTPRKCPVSRRSWYPAEQVRQLAEKMKPAR